MENAKFKIGDRVFLIKTEWADSLFECRQEAIIVGKSNASKKTFNRKWWTGPDGDFYDISYMGNVYRDVHELELIRMCGVKEHG